MSHDWLIFFASTGIGIPISIKANWGSLLAGLFCGGLNCLFRLLVC